MIQKTGAREMTFALTKIQNSGIGGHAIYFMESCGFGPGLAFLLSYSLGVSNQQTICIARNNMWFRLGM